MFCSYLQCEVELTEERERHIMLGHPELLPEHRRLIEEVLLDPDLIRRSDRMPTALMLSKWYQDLQHGKHVVVVVISDQVRTWIVTSYIARKITGGEVVWKKVV